ncbi:MAG: cyclic nucleotide-binding domain-containing protein [Chloroflexi bacterium]|nr:cyclic nucleotide-binding domain-containing protein [Chloroflexota bacterium]
MTNQSIIREAIRLLVVAGFFTADDEESLAELATMLEPMVIASGQTLMEQGEPGDSMYVVVSGRLQVYVRRDEEEVLVGEVGRGEVVGEMALLTSEPRSATVRAVRDTQVARLSQDGFERLMLQHPQAMRGMMRTIVERFRRLLRSPRLERRLQTLVALPITEGVSLPDFLAKFETALAPLAKTFVCTQERMAQTLGSDSPAHAMVSWMNDLELNYEFVLYVASEDPLWLERCLRQADRLLLVANASEQPRRERLNEDQWREVAGRVDLALIHPDDADQGRGASAWLDAFDVKEHFNLRMGDDIGFRHMARRFTGNSLGLVFGGGSARGYAHVGVLRALEESGIEIDMIGGTSMGAMMAAVSAMNWDYEEIRRHVAVFGSNKRVFDYTLPLTSLTAGGKVTYMTKTLFGDVQIEELWRPFFCVSTNLSQAEPMVHTRGPLWKAVRSSIAIPGVFSPVLYEGDVLVDGGIMNNLPVDVMYEQLGADAVITVNVSPLQTRPRNYNFGDRVSGWRILWGRLIPFVKPLRAPSLMGTLMRSLELNSVYRVKQEMLGMSDLVLLPDLRDFSPGNFSEYEEIIEIGYRTAMDALASWTPPVAR